MTADFFRVRLETMIDLRHPLAVLASRMEWAGIEAGLAPLFARTTRVVVKSRIAICSGLRCRWPVPERARRDAPDCRSG